MKDRAGVEPPVGERKESKQNLENTVLPNVRRSLRRAVNSGHPFQQSSEEHSIVLERRL